MSADIDLSELFPAASGAYGELRSDGQVDVILSSPDLGFTMNVDRMANALDGIRRRQIETGVGVDLRRRSGYTSDEGESPNLSERGTDA